MKDLKKINEPIEPFNELWYQTCYYNSLFPILKHFNKDIEPFICNDIFYYSEEDNCISFNFSNIKKEDDILNELGIIKKSFKSLNLKENIISTINNNVLPASANQGVYYVSSNPSVVSVGYTSGLVCANSVGQATITAYSSVDNSKWSTCKVRVVNNIEIFEAIDALYEYAELFSPNDINEQQVLVLQYIRRQVYNGLLWDFTAGFINSSFINFVNQNNSTLATFFNGSNNSKGAILVDNYGNEIDFYHLIATLNGLLHLNDGLLGTIGKNLCGWAGDLQSLVPEVLGQLNIISYDNIYNTTYYLLSSGESINFSHNDLYADVDAYNIYTALNNISSISFGDYFKNYYEYQYYTRFSCFANDWDREAISSLVKDYLSYPLVLGDFIWLTTEQRNAFRDAFTDYIWLQIQNE